jgi:hypothetical protein
VSTLYCALKNSKNKIAHATDCSHISKHSSEDLIFFDDRKDVLEHGYRLCKHCQILNKQFKKEQNEIDEYSKRFSLTYKFVYDKVFVKSQYDEWAIVEDNGALSLFHKSKKLGGAEDKFIFGFHNQNVKYNNFKKMFKYISAHDNFLKNQKTTLTIVENKPKNATIKKVNNPDWMKKKPKPEKPQQPPNPFLHYWYNHDYQVHKTLNATYGMSVKLECKNINVRFEGNVWKIKDHFCDIEEKLIIYYLNQYDELIYVAETETLSDALLEITEFYYEFLKFDANDTDQYIHQGIIDCINQGVKKIEKQKKKKKKAVQKEEKQKAELQRIDALFALLESRKAVATI